MTKTCTLRDFMAELKPWLDRDHIRRAELDVPDHLILHFNDGMKNVYAIDDCDAVQLEEVLKNLAGRGIEVVRSA